MKMKRVIPLLITVLLIGGCVTSASKWNEAQQRNTIFAYQTFLREYPDSLEAAEAKARLQQLEVEKKERQAKMEKSELVKKQQDEAKKLLAYWDREGMSKFIATHPESEYIPQLQSSLDKLNRLFQKTEELAKDRQTDKCTTYDEMVAAIGQPNVNIIVQNETGIERLCYTFWVVNDPDVENLHGFINIGCTPIKTANGYKAGKIEYIKIDVGSF